MGSVMALYQKESPSSKKVCDGDHTRNPAVISLGMSRTKVTQMLKLLKLDEEIQGFILGLEKTDERLKVLTEWRLRELVKIEDGKVQKERFLRLIDIDL